LSIIHKKIAQKKGRLSRTNY